MFKEGRLKHRNHIYPYYYGIFLMGGGATGCVLVQDPFSHDNLKVRIAEVAQTTYDQHLQDQIELKDLRWFGTYWYDTVHKARSDKISAAEMRRRYLCQVPDGARMLEEVRFKIARKGLMGRESKLVKLEWKPYQGSPEWHDKVMTNLDNDLVGDYRNLI